MHFTASRLRNRYFWASLLASTFVAMWYFDPRVARLWLNSAALAVGATCIAVPLGLIAALIIVKTDAPCRRLAAAIFAGALFIPLFLVAGAWDAGFGIQGWHTLMTNPNLARQPLLSGWRAAIWIHGLAGVPWATLIVGVGLAAVERELEESASLIMSPVRVLWHVTLPRIRPAIAVASLWVAMIASVEISVTDFFQVRTFAEEVYTLAALGSPIFGEDVANRASATAWCLGLLMFALLAVVVMLVARQALREFGGLSLRATWHGRLGMGRWPAAAILVLIVLLVAGVPLANLIYKAGGTVAQTVQGRERSWSATQSLVRIAEAPREFAGDLWLSTWIGIASATGSLLVGVPFAWQLRSSHRPPLFRVLALSLCFTIPGPVLGIAVIHLLNRPPDSWLAALAPLYDSQFPTWLVQMIRSLPLVTLLLWAAFASIPRTLLETAALDGAGWWRQLVLVASPIRMRAIAVAWLVAFAVAMSELAATVLVLPPGRATAITVRVFQLLHYGADERVAAISIVLTIATALITGSAIAISQVTTRIASATNDS
jgi:iron(III) transport system permease protein